VLRHTQRGTASYRDVACGSGAVALGTFNNHWFQLNFSMAFPFLALFTLASLDPARWRRGVAHSLAIGGPCCGHVLAAFAPYSLPAPIFDQQIPIESRSPTARFCRP